MGAGAVVGVECGVVVVAVVEEGVLVDGGGVRVEVLGEEGWLFFFRVEVGLGCLVRRLVGPVFLNMDENENAGILRRGGLFLLRLRGR